MGGARPASGEQIGEVDEDRALLGDERAVVHDGGHLPERVHREVGGLLLLAGLHVEDPHLVRRSELREQDARARRARVGGVVVDEGALRGRGRIGHVDTSGAETTALPGAGIVKERHGTMSTGVTTADPTLGILDPSAGLRRFELRRHAVAPELAKLVDWHWVVRWSLTEPFEQEILPHPCVNLSFAAGHSAVTGILTRRDVRRLVGTGRVVATKFKPGGFFPFASCPMRALCDRVVTLVEAFGVAAPAIERSVLDAPEDAPAIAAIEELLIARRVAAGGELDLAMQLAARAEADRDLRRVEDLARIAGVSVRTLHRSFERYIGVGPKWILRRARVQEAAERVASGTPVVWAELAQELGYHDQAHLIHDFKIQIGMTPAAYAKRCEASSA